MRTKRTRNSRSIYKYESLEPKHLLASVALLGEQLTIFGQVGDSQIEVSSNDDSMSYQVHHAGSLLGEFQVGDVRSVLFIGHEGVDDLLATNDADSDLPDLESFVFVGKDADDQFLFDMHGLDASTEVIGFGGEGDDSLAVANSVPYAIELAVSFYGGAGDDTLVGGFGADRLIGGLGSDRLEGSVNNDVLVGDAGDDDLFGGSGHDRLIGGDGNDSLYGGESSPLDDQVDGEREAGGDDYLSGGNGFDQLYAGDGANTALGGEGVDIIKALEGDDTIYGGGGDDRIYAGDGRDYVFGQGGNDRLFGGPGTDYLYGHEGDDVLNGFIGNDWLAGGVGDDLLAGGEGNDRLYGSQGDDSLLGEGGADFLNGGVGEDYLGGGDGDDRFRGGAGIDMLVGNTGVDRFYEPFIDKLLDFDDEEDLRAHVFTASDYIGLSEAEAVELAESDSRDYRISQREAEYFFLTADYVPDRLNFTILDGEIATARFG